MKTVPLDPIWQNKRFRDFTPVIRCAILDAVYYLSKENLLSDIPARLQSYFNLANATYWRNKPALHEVLHEIARDIIKVKQPIDYRAERMRISRSRKIAENKASNSKEATFSDDTASRTKFTPLSAPANPFHKGQFDHVTTKKAKDSNDQAQEKTFIDD